MGVIIVECELPGQHDKKGTCMGSSYCVETEVSTLYATVCVVPELRQSTSLPHLRHLLFYLARKSRTYYWQPWKDKLCCCKAEADH